MRRIRIGIVMLMVLLFAVGSAYAGYNWVIVATDGEGTPVYASATSKRQIGTLYNGFSDSIDLFDTNGLYGCRLTTDTKGWINQEMRYQKRSSQCMSFQALRPHKLLDNRHF